MANKTFSVLMLIVLAMAVSIVAGPRVASAQPAKGGVKLARLLGPQKPENQQETRKASDSTTKETVTDGGVVPPPSPNNNDVVQPAGQTLDELTALAQSNNPTLRQAAAEVESARGKAWQAGLYPNPVLSGGANQIVGNQSQYFGALSQEIVTKGKLRLDQAVACREVAQAEQAFVQSRFNLLTVVRQQFVVALAAQRRMEVTAKMVQIMDKSLQSANKLQAAGEASRIDTLLFEIELEKSEVNRENAETRWQAARRQLAAHLGVRELTIVRLVGDLTSSMEEVAQQVMSNDSYVPHNAAVSMAEQDVERTKLLLQRAIVEPFPNVTIYAGYQRQIEPALHNMGLLNASLPLPLWNRNEGNIASATAQVHKSQATVEQVQNTVFIKLAEATGRFRVADQQVRRYESRIVPKAREGVTLMQTGMLQGQTDFQRLLQAQRALVEANLGYIDALEARWIAAADLAGLAQMEVFP